MQISNRPGVISLISLCALAAVIAVPTAFAFDAFKPLPPTPIIPADNPQSGAKVDLGRQLYFDPRLSVSGTVTCNTCHNLIAGGDDGRAVSVGALGKAGTRSAPTLWNVAYETVYFWDGRAKSLEAAIQEHLLNKTVMAMPDATTLTDRFDHIPGYKREFDYIFADAGGVSLDNTAKALASFIRTLSTRDSPFDRYLEGDDTAISASAEKGFQDFVNLGCGACHFWVNLAGPVPGLAFQMGEGFYELFPNWPGSHYDEQYHLTDDLGRYYFDKNPNHKHLFRVPTLRNVAQTAPYFHNGAVKTLDEAVRVMAKTQFKRNLTDRQVRDIVAFLNTLTGEFPPMIMPRLPPSPGASVLDHK
jgi:cytochrome c peroxidase